MTEAERAAWRERLHREAAAWFAGVVRAHQEQPRPKTAREDLADQWRAGRDRLVK